VVQYTVVMFELTGELKYIVPLMLTMMSLWPTFLFFSVSGSYNVWVDRRTTVYCTTNVNYDVTVTYFSIFQSDIIVNISGTIYCSPPVNSNIITTRDIKNRKVGHSDIIVNISGTIYCSPPVNSFLCHMSHFSNRLIMVFFSQNMLTFFCL
jgi:hypothetical protein